MTKFSTLISGWPSKTITQDERWGQRSTAGGTWRVQQDPEFGRFANRASDLDFWLLSCFWFGQNFSGLSEIQLGCQGWNFMEAQKQSMSGDQSGLKEIQRQVINFFDHFFSHSYKMIIVLKFFKASKESSSKGITTFETNWFELEH